MTDKHYNSQLTSPTGICTLCSEKNTHSHFLSYVHEGCVDLNNNCIEYTQGKVDCDNVEIRYSLQPIM